MLKYVSGWSNNLKFVGDCVELGYHHAVYDRFSLKGGCTGLDCNKITVELI